MSCPNCALGDVSGVPRFCARVAADMSEHRTRTAANHTARAGGLLGVLTMTDRPSRAILSNIRSHNAHGGRKHVVGLVLISECRQPGLDLVPVLPHVFTGGRSRTLAVEGEHVSTEPCRSRRKLARGELFQQFSVGLVDKNILTMFGQFT